MSDKPSPALFAAVWLLMILFCLLVWGLIFWAGAQL